MLGDIDRLAGAGVATHLGPGLPLAEYAETAEIDLLAAGKDLAQRAKDGLNPRLSGVVRHVVAPGDHLGEFVLCHRIVLSFQICFVFFVVVGLSEHYEPCPVEQQAPLSVLSEV